MGNSLLQRGSFQKLHRDERLAVVLTDLVNGANAGMVQSGSGLRFALKTAERLRVFSNIIRKKFESDKTAEAGVFSFVDDAHAAATELLQNTVMSNDLIGHSRGSGIR